MASSITIDISGMEIVRQKLADLEGDAKRIIRLSVNKGVKSARTEAGRQIRAKFTIRQKALYTGSSSNKATDKLKMNLATVSNPSASVYASGGPRDRGFRLTEFKHSVVKRGVNTEMRLGKKSLIAHAWKMVIPHATVEGIFGRTLAGSFPASKRKFTPMQYRAMPPEFRKPIHHYRGFTAAQMLDDGDGVQKAADVGAEVFADELARLSLEILGD